MKMLSRQVSLRNAQSYVLFDFHSTLSQHGTHSGQSCFNLKIYILLFFLILFYRIHVHFLNELSNHSLEHEIKKYEVTT